MKKEFQTVLNTYRLYLHKKWYTCILKTNIICLIKKNVTCSLWLDIDIITNVLQPDICKAYM